MSQLVQHLTNALTSLKTGIIKYDWKDSESCNCGIVLQSCLNLIPGELKKVYEAEAENTSQDRPTWQFLIQSNCSSTGIPVQGVFLKLYQLGFHPSDFTHLEFLDNKAILNNIPQDTFYKTFAQPLTWTQSIYKFFGGKPERTYKRNQFKLQECLILYLTSWLDILQKDVEKDHAKLTTKNLVGKEILKAKAFGNPKELEKLETLYHLV